MRFIPIVSMVLGFQGLGFSQTNYEELVAVLVPYVEIPTLIGYVPIVPAVSVPAVPVSAAVVWSPDWGPMSSWEAITTSWLDLYGLEEVRYPADLSSHGVKFSKIRDKRAKLAGDGVWWRNPILLKDAEDYWAGVASYSKGKAERAKTVKARYQYVEYPEETP